MVSHLCLFSINVHAVPNADHAWAPADMKAAAGLQFIINVHAVLYADHAWAPCDMKVAAALQFIKRQTVLSQSALSCIQRVDDQPCQTQT